MRIPTLALTALAFVGTATAATLALQAVDNTRFPDLFGERQKQLAAAKVDIATAIATAEKASGGKAYSAALAADGETARWDVVAFAGDVEHKVRINAATGAVDADVVTPKAVLPGAAPVGEPQKSASGLVWYDLAVGQGPQPAGPQNEVSVHYTGWTLDGRKFDSSVDRGSPATFPLGRVIAGWTEGVGTMRVGGKRKLVIPARLAYGANPPFGSGIPANAPLVFDVELLQIVK
jgi:FKBP-type peptidyl-prolyl cis-trans isomerase